MGFQTDYVQKGLLASLPWAAWVGGQGVMAILFVFPQAIIKPCPPGLSASLLPTRPLYPGANPRDQLWSRHQAPSLRHLLPVDPNHSASNMLEGKGRHPSYRGMNPEGDPQTPFSIHPSL